MIARAAPPAGVVDVGDSVMLPTIAGAAPSADVAKVVTADAASLANAGILFPADPVGTLSLTDQDGTLSPTDLAGILFSAVPAGILFQADPAGILFPVDLSEPVTVGVADLADAGILFPAVPAGIPFPNDPAGILFPADLAEPVTVGVADLANAGILFPAIPAGIPFPADPAGILFPANLAEPVTVGVADLDVAGAAPWLFLMCLLNLSYLPWKWRMKWGQWMGFPFITVVIMTVCGIRNVMTLDILAILMVSPITR